MISKLVSSLNSKALRYHTRPDSSPGNEIFEKKKYHSIVVIEYQVGENTEMQGARHVFMTQLQSDLYLVCFTISR